MKIKNLLVCGISTIALALSIASCGESTNEQHTIGFSKQYVQVYADQTIDSVHIYSTDDWTFRMEGESWAKATYNGKNAPFGDKVNINGMPIKAPRVDLMFTPNTTGLKRTALLFVTSSFTKVGTAMAQLIQAPFLNISTPSREVYVQNNKECYMYRTYVDAEGKTGAYTDALGNKIEGVNPKITFTVYADGATLTPVDEWIKVINNLSNERPTYKKQELQTVQLLVAENTSKEKRTGKVLLNSNGITDTITVVQAPVEEQSKK